MFCIHCGKQLIPGSKFCSFCGKQMQTFGAPVATEMSFVQTQPNLNQVQPLSNQSQNGFGPAKNVNFHPQGLPVYEQQIQQNTSDSVYNNDPQNYLSMQPSLQPYNQMQHGQQPIVINVNADGNTNRLTQHLKDGIDILPYLGDQQCQEEGCTQHARYICYSDIAQTPISCASCIYKPTCSKEFCEVHARFKLIQYETGSKYNRRHVEYHIRICSHCEKKIDEQTKKASKINCCICVSIIAIFLIPIGVIISIFIWISKQF